MSYYLKSFGVIKVEGPERHSFLHSQFSNEVNNLHPGEACFANYVTAKGRVIANFLLIVDQEEIYLILYRDVIDLMIKKLTLYRLRSKVEFTDISDTLAVFAEKNRPPDAVPYPLKFISERKKDGLYAYAPDGSDFKLLTTEKASSEQSIEENDWFLSEIKAGVPWVSKETSEVFFPHMLNQEFLGAINFKKGCYPGQQIVARSEYIGQVKRLPALVKGRKPTAPGATLWKNGSEVVRIVNVAYNERDFYALAVVKDKAEGPFLPTPDSPEDPWEKLHSFNYGKLTS